MRPATSSAVDPAQILDSRTAGRRVIRGGAIRVIGYAAGILLAVASAALLLRYLDPADFGQYAVVTSLVAIVGSFSEAGLGSVALREFTVRGPEERGAVMQNLLALRLGLTTIGIGVAVIFGFAVGYENVVILGSLIAGVGLLVTVVQQTYTIPLGAGLRIRAITLLDLVRQATTVPVLILVIVGGGGLLSILAVPVPVGLLVLLLTIPLVRRVFPLLPRFQRAIALRMARMVAVYSVAMAVGTLYIFTPIVALSLLGSEAETGYFGAAYRIFQVPATIPLLLIGTAFPLLVRTAHDDQERLVYAVQRLLEVALILGAWMALAAYFFAPLAIDIVAGSGYEASVSVLRIVGLALLGGFLAVTLSFTLLSLRAHAEILISNTLAFVVSVALNVVLIPSMGADGAAVALVAADGVLVATYGWLWLRRRWTSFDPRIIPRVAIAAGLAGALAAVPDVPAFALGIAATGIYAAAIIALRAVPGELREAFLRGGQDPGTVGRDVA